MECGTRDHDEEKLKWGDWLKADWETWHGSDLTVEVCVVAVEELQGAEQVLPLKVAASSRNPINWEPRLIRSFIKGCTKIRQDRKISSEDKNSTSKIRW
jgi:hypothetical protein